MSGLRITVAIRVKRLLVGLAVQIGYGTKLIVRIMRLAVIRRGFAIPARRRTAAVAPSRATSTSSPPTTRSSALFLVLQRRLAFLIDCVEPLGILVDEGRSFHVSTVGEIDVKIFAIGLQGIGLASFTVGAFSRTWCPALIASAASASTTSTPRWPTLVAVFRAFGIASASWRSIRLFALIRAAFENIFYRFARGKAIEGFWYRLVPRFPRSGVAIVAPLWVTLRRRFAFTATFRCKFAASSAATTPTSTSSTTSRIVIPISLRCVTLATRSGSHASARARRIARQRFVAIDTTATGPGAASNLGIPTSPMHSIVGSRIRSASTLPTTCRPCSALS